MTNIREYLVRTPDGHDYGRDADLEAAKRAASDLGDGAVVVALDDFLLPIRTDGVELIVHTVGGGYGEEAILCPYHRCDYRATSEADLDEHLLAMPTEAAEHWNDSDDALPRRTPGTFTPLFGNI